MAVIQDLPAERLCRVIELLSDEEDRDGNLLDALLTSTSLVARAWRPPSQELLLHNLTLETFAPPNRLSAIRSFETRTQNEVDLFPDQAPAVLELLGSLRRPCSHYS